MKETATKGLAVASVGFLITSRLAVKTMAQRFMVSLGRSRLHKAALRLPRDKSQALVLLEAETIPPVGQELSLHQSRTNAPCPPPVALLAGLQSQAGARQTWPDTASPTTASKKKALTISIFASDVRPPPAAPQEEEALCSL